MKGLTPKQCEILDFIQQFMREHHYSPSYREIMEHFAFSSPGTVYKHLRTLQQKGAITTEKNSHRSITPIESIRINEKPPEIELQLIGNLSAGYPLELFVRSKTIAVPSSLVHEPDNTYILQVQGDALHDEWIQDGDLILVEARQDIQPGEMILGLINQHDTVVKRYFPEGNNLRLESRHPKQKPLIVRHAHIAIQGVLVGLLRLY